MCTFPANTVLYIHTNQTDKNEMNFIHERAKRNYVNKKIDEINSEMFDLISGPDAGKNQNACKVFDLMVKRSKLQKRK